MRIAICFSGPVGRLFENPDVFGNQLKILKGFSHCDLFFSLSGEGPEVEVADIANSKAQAHLEGCYQIAKVERTPQYPNHSKYVHMHQCWSQGNSPGSIFSMYGGIKRADMLRQEYEKEGGFNYDLVIRSRTDIDVVGNPELQKWIHSVHHRCLLIVPKNYNWIEHWNEQGMLNDQWFAANSHTMTMVSALVDHIEEYVDNGCRFHPETLLWWHIKRLPVIPGTDRDFNATPYFRPIDIETVLRGLRGY